MNAGAVPDALVQPQPVIRISALRRLYWCVRRELWESRSIYLAPLVVAVLILAGFAIRLVHLPETLRGAAALDAVHRHGRMEQPYTVAAMLLMFTTVVVALFYCLDALHGERRDRSILFWKSMPVSDATTVLAKASIPVVVIPLVTFLVTFATQAIMLLLASARLTGTGLSVWSHLSFGQMSWMLFYHLVIGHGLWYAPFWGWLLFCSAWARRAPWLWATLPLIAVGLLERIAFNTSHFGHWIGYRFMGGPVAGAPGEDPMTISALTPASPADFLASPGFWFGLGLTALFLWAAVRLRRARGPI